jgi:7-cyano-7-deazaguanine synthase in queuosine biosynthesis
VTKIVIPLSGGLLSAVLAAWAIEHYDEVHAVALAYSPRQRVEMQHARIVAKRLSLTSFEQVEWQGEVHGPMNPVVLLGLAVERALVLRCDGVGTSEMTPILCSIERELVGHQVVVVPGRDAIDYRPLGLATPFLGLSRAHVIELGRKLDAGALMASTWSCSMGGHAHCGTCSGCARRREAFAEAGVLDQTIYEG